MPTSSKLRFITLLCFIQFVMLQKMNSQAALTYPQTRKGDVTDTYFGTQIPDKYRWLEDDRSAETGAWVDAQNQVTFSYLDKIPFRTKIRERLSSLWNFEKYTTPFREGAYTYFYKNNGLQNQYVLWRKKDGQDAEVFLDPNTFSASGTTSLADISFSQDGSLAAYQVSEGGADWRKVVVIETDSRKQVGDTLFNIKFSGIAWHGNQGFYYSSYDHPEGSKLSAKTDQHKLYFHKLGTSQKEDMVIFGEQAKRRYVGAGVSDDQRYLFISAANSTSGNELYLVDLTKDSRQIVPVLTDFDSDTE
jgi:prolyl oligopeptidase